MEKKINKWIGFFHNSINTTKYYLRKFGQIAFATYNNKLKVRLVPNMKTQNTNDREHFIPVIIWK